jgi:hypothetical protein
MTLDSPELARERLSDRLKRMSASAWVTETDRLARFDTIAVDEALTLLGRRFGGAFLESRRHIVWLLIEYVYLSFEPEAWKDPMRYRPRRRSARRARGAAA